MTSPRLRAGLRRRALLSSLALLFLQVLFSSYSIAGITVPSGASISLNGGTISLGETSLDVAGTLQVGSGQLTDILDVAVAAAGNLSATSGLIELSGNWQVLGAFTPGVGDVRFIDGISSNVWNVLGSTQFASLSLLSSVGKHFVVEPGSTQRISQLLTIAGTAVLPLQIERLPSGAVGRFDLQPGGSQAISHVGVSNVHAIGQPLASTQTNQGGSGNAIGWFGTVLVPPPLFIPVNSPWVLILFSFLLLLVARRFGPFSASRFS